MNKIECLLKELCPNGVEYKRVGDIATDIYRGTGITRDQITAEGMPCVRYGEIYTTYGVWFDSCVSHTEISRISSPKFFEYGDILFAITGESIEDIAKCTAYIGKEKCLAGGDIVVLKHEQDPKYLSYALSTTDARLQKGKGKVKSKVVHSSVPAIKDLVIPVPPLDVQREIARILDKLSFRTTELKEELMKERVARRKQYEYYMEKMLTFDEGIHTAQLRDVASFRNGKGHEKNITDSGKYIVVNSKFISTNGSVRKYANEQICPLYKDDILMVMSDLPNGRALAKCYLVEEDEKYTLNQRIGAFHVKNRDILTRFLLFVLNRNTQLLKYDNGVDQTNLKKDEILDIYIPIPSKEKQEKVVNFLEIYESKCANLEETLTAEMEMIQKQYDYYRDRLLMFKKA